MQGIKVDWTIKVSDVIKFVLVIVGLVVSYVHLADRVDKVEDRQVASDQRTQKTQEMLQQHIEREAEVVAKAVEVMSQMTQTLKDFPPHRHTKSGEIIFPNQHW